MKYDKGKAPIHLIPSEAIVAIAEVLGFGAEKYGENNWREDVDSTTWGRTYSSLQRHLTSFWSGEDTDPESGLPHIDHALAQLMILKIQTLETTNKAMDNRFKRENLSQLDKSTVSLKEQVDAIAKKVKEL